MQFTTDPPTGAWTTGGADVVHSQSDLATVYVRVPVQATAQGAAVDLSTGTVKIAFLEDLGPAAVVQPVTGDWIAATWDTDNTTVPATYAAQVLVGPGPGAAVALAVGVWRVWVQVTISGQVFVEDAGAIVIL